MGGRDLDKYELVLRHKETQAELDLFNPEACSVVVVTNTFKKEDSEKDAKKPDFIMKVFIKD